ncbi:uncharacterized protein At2g33490-like isoform X2 [Phalaenopsis equestris]|uniref:uncharacterized protein At2g33490-like isoform X2 n=1 Tax=Phalaenopsis equestris TaxID=78828 RepID=UPI0009E4D74F|nr:uncharacterized protein At2g33490-like isoform X2 [Phalaenopsis equestris]
MRSSLRKLRGMGLQRSELREKREHQPRAKLDELVQAVQDMQDMKSCYDGLLSTAAATANSAYEFSEALREMGTCLLEKTALLDDEDSGRVLLMLGKAQFELQKLVDNYRTHIIQTITTPSECLLSELQVVEEMKQQCDDKREYYKLMLTAPRVKGRLRNSKGDAVTLQQLQAAREDYEEDANLFIFRLKSLKQGQSRSLLTQAARHHAAQLNFFRKGLKSLELIEPHVKAVSEQRHIDYHFRGLEDDYTDFDDDGGSFCSDSSNDGELDFDYGLNEQSYNALSVNLMELDQVDSTPAKRSSLELLQESIPKKQPEPLLRNERPTLSSQSAPIFGDISFDLSEKTKERSTQSTRKYHTYALPTPLEAKNSASSVSTNISFSSNLPKTQPGLQIEQKLISPIEPHKPLDSKDKNLLPSPTRSPNTPSAPPKLMKLQAFSGPITGKSGSNKPFPASYGFPKAEDSASHSPVLNISGPSTNSSALTSPLKINALHELPRPPISWPQSGTPNNFATHSAPLTSRAQEIQTGRTFPVSLPTAVAASPLPAPPAFVPRSFSIPYRGQRTTLDIVNKQLEVVHHSHLNSNEELDSPTLTPLSLKNFAASSSPNGQM